jgi:predicted ATPase
VAPADLAAAERGNLVTLSDDRVAFRHPLVRAAAYQSVPHHQRLAVHLAFAGTLTDAKDADRRAWHLAAATTSPDEQVAIELERAAGRAQRRGGAMAVSSAYERAARLSTGADAAARRLVHAARAAYDAGRPDRAARLAAEAVSLTDEAATVAEATFVEAQVAYERDSPAADATLALEAASLIIRCDPERAVAMLAEAMAAARDACAPTSSAGASGTSRRWPCPPARSCRPWSRGRSGGGRCSTAGRTWPSPRCGRWWRRCWIGPPAATSTA